MPTLEDAIALAVEAHRGQVDKGGQPYILHPLRVMLTLESDMERIVAVLHDVVEDTEYSLDRLRALNYPSEALEALECLTRREGESYEAFIQRIKPDPVARQVKLADLKDNMNIVRLHSLSQKDFERIARYRNAWSVLRQPPIGGR
jgi:(p)ppGpp synthase/HD superfamily hydrolase